MMKKRRRPGRENAYRAFLKASKLKENFENCYLGLLMFAALAGIIHGIFIFRMTMIPARLLFSLFVIGALLFWFLHLKWFHTHQTAAWLQIGCSLIIGGGILYYFPLLANQHFTKSAIEKVEKFSIEKTGNLGKGRKDKCQLPYAEITYQGLPKQLVFSCKYEKSIHDYKFVQLSTQKGFLGFDVIKEKTLIK